MGAQAASCAFLISWLWHCVQRASVIIVPYRYASESARMKRNGYLIFVITSDALGQVSGDGCMGHACPCTPRYPAGLYSARRAHQLDTFPCRPKINSTMTSAMQFLRPIAVRDP